MATCRMRIEILLDLDGLGIQVCEVLGIGHVRTICENLFNTEGLQVASLVPESVSPFPLEESAV